MKKYDTPPPSETDVVLVLKNDEGVKYTLVIPEEMLPQTDVDFHDNHLHVLMDFRI